MQWICLLQDVAAAACVVARLIIPDGGLIHAQRDHQLVSYLSNIPIAMIPNRVRLDDAAHSYVDLLLPDNPRKARIVISREESLLYLFDRTGSRVELIAAVTLGADHSPTPLGTTRITEKLVNPVWTVLRQIKGAMKWESIPAGPDNPLGRYALRLGRSDILIHETPDPVAVEPRGSAGCIRISQDNMRIVFPLITPGDLVEVQSVHVRRRVQGSYLYEQEFGAMRIFSTSLAWL